MGVNPSPSGRDARDSSPFTWPRTVIRTRACIARGGAYHARATSGRSCGGPEIPMTSVNPLNVIRLVPANGQVLLHSFFARLHPGLLYHGGDRTCVSFKYLR